jgi:N-methylhydantoinase B
MATELRKICMSTVIREAQDFATAITDAQGRLIAQSTGTPGHYNSIPSAVKGTLKKIKASDIKDGDVLITNDPWICAGHLPDLVVMTPVFWEDKLIAFTVTIAHHIDVGGKNPGSTTANTTEIYQEGLQVPPVKFVKQGKVNQEIESIIRENVRLPDTIIHDIHCEMAVNNRGKERLIKDLCEKYSGNIILECFETAITKSEKMMREEIARIPDGTYTFEDFIEDDGVTDKPLKVKATVTVSGSNITVDFTDSSPQTSGGINMTPSFRDSYTQLAIRCYIDPSIPHNEGCFRPIKISAPEGTIVNPMRPAAVAGRSVMISRVVDVVMACMAQALPSRAVAGYGGCNAQPVISGIHPKTGKFFIFLDTNWGGLGGRSGKDGVTCLSFPQNIGNHPIEVLESFYPVRVERYEIRTDSEGAGEFRGGFGSIKDYTFLCDVKLQVPGDRTKIPPFGLQGGKPAALTEYLCFKNGKSEHLKTKHEYHLQKGDLLSVRTPGGGGLGDPKSRSVQLVKHDVNQGYIDQERAIQVYAISPDHFKNLSLL